jgi:photosystem II stability/assembly factor-like uncharacterized protein
MNCRGCAGGESIALTSDDGVNWVQRLSGKPYLLYGIAYGNGQFVAVGHPGMILTSTDRVD